MKTLKWKNNIAIVNKRIGLYFRIESILVAGQKPKIFYLLEMCCIYKYEQKITFGDFEDITLAKNYAQQCYNELINEGDK